MVLARASDRPGAGTLPRMHPDEEHALHPPEAMRWQGALEHLFPDLPAHLLRALAAQGQRQSLRSGQSLLRPGQSWRWACWVERGALRLYYVGIDGLESNKNFHLDGALIWPITPQLRMEPVCFHVDALQPTVVWCLDMEALEASVGPLASWRALRLQALTALLEDKMARERAFLQEDARQRYEALLRERPAWAARIPLRHLASYLGMTDVSLSRLRARMGLIRR